MTLEAIILKLKDMVEDTNFDLDRPTSYPGPSVELVCEELNQLAEAVGMKDVLEGRNTTRKEALELGAYQVVIDIWSKICQIEGIILGQWENRSETVLVLEATLNALYSLTPGNSDIADMKAFLMLRQSINHKCPQHIQILGLKVLRNVCTKSEENRDTLVVTIGIVPPLVSLIRKRGLSTGKKCPTAELLRQWCAAVQSLLLSDDKRVRYNRAVERARTLVREDVIQYLVRFLSSYEYVDGATHNALVIVLSALAIKNEFVEMIADNNMMNSLVKLLSTQYSNELLTQHTLTLLKLLCICPTVREQTSGYEILKHVFKVAHYYRDNAVMVEGAMSCLVYMTLRCPAHIELVLIRDGVEDILRHMTKHIESIPILKNACFLLRNIAVHGKEEGRKRILDNDGENIINQIEQKYPEIKYNYTKPLLRDLRLPVSPTLPPKTTSLDLITPVIGNPDDLQRPIKKFDRHTYRYDCITLQPVQSKFLPPSNDVFDMFDPVVLSGNPSLASLTSQVSFTRMAD